MLLVKEKKEKKLRNSKNKFIYFLYFVKGLFLALKDLFKEILFKSYYSEV